MFMLPITLLIFLVLVFLVFMLFVLFSALFCAFVTFLLLNCALSFSNVLFFLVLFLFGHCQSRGKEVLGQATAMCMKQVCPKLNSLTFLSLERAQIQVCMKQSSSM